MGADMVMENEEQDGMALLATFAYPMQAKFARAQLEGEGIRCFLRNERTLDIDVFLTNVLGGYQLYVPAADAERAKEVLASRVSDEELTKQAEAAAPEAE